MWIRGWEDGLGLPTGTVVERLAEHEPAGSVITGEVTEAQMWDAYCGRLDVELRDFCAGLRPSYTTAILSNSADDAAPGEIVFLDDSPQHVAAPRPGPSAGRRCSTHRSGPGRR